MYDWYDSSIYFNKPLLTEHVVGTDLKGPTPSLGIGSEPCPGSKLTQTLGALGAPSERALTTPKI